MGIRRGTTQELATRRVLKTLTATAAADAAADLTGTTPDFEPSVDRRSAKGGEFNFVVGGTFVTATVICEESYDGGTTFVQSYDIFGVAVSLTARGARRLRQTEPGVLYRGRCTVYTSVTTLTVRLSQ